VLQATGHLRHSGCTMNVAYSDTILGGVTAKEDNQINEAVRVHIGLYASVGAEGNTIFEEYKNGY